MRPTFTLNNQPVRAGGVLFYWYDSMIDQCQLLMIKSRDKYEDFGGQTDETDEDIIDTISREVEEESNEFFKKIFVKNKIKDVEPIYIKNCKYVLYVAELDKYCDPAIFGDYEKVDKIHRTVEWIPYEIFNTDEFKNKLNFRLTAYNVLQHLKIKFSQDK